MAQMNVRPVPSCTECGLEAAGRCPLCRHNLCMDHFGLDEHNPCAARHRKHGDEYICYVCGVTVRPQQWSTAIFAHYVDSGKCRGCGRYICDSQHTHLRDESVEIVRDGLRSHRYHVTQRYCAICAPLRRVGGLVGVTGWIATLALLSLFAYLLLRASA